MSQETKLAEEMLADVVINTKTLGQPPNSETAKWINVVDVVIEGGEKKFVVEASTESGRKSIPENQARYIQRYLGIRFLLIPENQPNAGVGNE